MTDIVVLATLLSGPKHGYQLKHQAGLILGQANLHNNLVYPLLRRFAEQGWVTRKTVAGRRGQTRLQYAITASGRKALISKLTEFSGANARSLDAFLARVGLFQVLDPRAREGVLEARSAHLRARNEHLSGIAERFSLDLYARATIEFLRSQVEAELAWIGHLRKISQS